MENWATVSSASAEQTREIGAQIARLHRFWREFRRGRDIADGAVIGLGTTVCRHFHRHPGRDAAEVGFVDIGPDPHRPVDGERHQGIAGLGDGAGLTRTG